MPSYYGNPFSRAGQRGRGSAALSAPPIPTLFGYNAAGIGPGGRSTASSAGAYLDRALTLATAKAGATGVSPGGQYRNALSQAAQAGAAAKAAAVAAMPHIGMGGLGARPAGAGATAAADATAALFGGSGPPPSYGGNPFVLGPLGGGYGAGGRSTDPRARYDRAIQQGANALFGMLRTPGGDAPDGPYALALANSARAVAAANADFDAEGSLFGTGYGTLTPGNQATRAAAARLAAELGVGPLGSGYATTAWPPRGRGGAATSGTPPWRFGMAQNPYLTRHLSAGTDTGRYDAANPGGPGYTAPMAPPHMVREGYHRPRPELAFPTESGRIAPDVGGGAGTTLREMAAPGCTTESISRRRLGLRW